MIHLGVNIDHVATLRQVRFALAKTRQARRAQEPDPVLAATLCESAGAHNITVHLREDRRHIQDSDLKLLRKALHSKLNLELANVPSMVRIALRVKPDQVTLVPEKRRELTTEGGLDVLRNKRSLQETILCLSKAGIQTGLFVNPQLRQVKASQETGASFIELHTGRFANAQGAKAQKRELKALSQAAETAHSLGLKVHAGHGLHYRNIHEALRIPYLEEVNIGHAIVSRSVFAGLEKAVREMLELIKNFNPCEDVS